MIQALGEYVYIKKISDQKQTASGIVYDLRYNKDYWFDGEVLSIGENVKIPIKVGDKVFCQRMEAIPIKDNLGSSENFQFINYKFIYGKYE